MTNKTQAYKQKYYELSALIADLNGMIFRITGQKNSILFLHNERRALSDGLKSLKDLRDNLETVRENIGVILKKLRIRHLI